jgi:hypothetical protein
MMGPQSFDTPFERASLDITRLHTVRLVPPEVAVDIARRRAALATTHELEATRLRQLADTEMTLFERVSGAAFGQLDEWLALQRLVVRSFAQERRHQALTRELERLEKGLARQWQTIAWMLRQAAHHEASAEILRSGRFQH